MTVEKPYLIFGPSPSRLETQQQQAASSLYSRLARSGGASVLQGSSDPFGFASRTNWTSCPANPLTLPTPAHLSGPRLLQNCLFSRKSPLRPPRLPVGFELESQLEYFVELADPNSCESSNN